MIKDSSEGYCNEIALLATGGTIATPAGYPERDRLTAADLIDKVQHSAVLSDMNLTGVDFSSLPSSRLTPQDVLNLKMECEKAADAGAGGLVITHGTDLMEETSFLLSRLWDRPQPVVLTGAMRPADCAGEDGPRNLVSACLTAACPDAEDLGAVVVMNEEIHSAEEVTKGHTWALDAFVSEPGPLGFIGPAGTVNFIRSPDRPQPVATPGALQKRVVVLQAGMGSGGSSIWAAVDDGVAGIVVQAAGRGALPPGMHRALQEAASEDILVVVCSRCPFGSTRRGHRGDDFIWSGRYNAVKSRVLLMLALSLWGPDRKAALRLF